MKDAVYNTASYFKFDYEDEWITDPFVKEMILDVDKSVVLDSGVIDSPVLGKIPPTGLSGGVKTLILVKFDKDKIFAVQGDFSLFQCSKPCRQETFYNEKYIREMIKYKKEMKIPTELIPKCPYCGENMSMNLRADSTFVQDKNWDKQKSKYENFLKNSDNSKILFLELGVGFNTPSIIKYNFWRMTLNNKKSVYASINLGECYCASDIAERSICIDADISEVLKKLIK